jgi:hypothetical protein
MNPTDFVALVKARNAGRGRWVAQCPAHPDRSPSLSICEGDDGRLLLHCFGGCTTIRILETLGLEMRDLFAGPLPNPEQLRAAKAAQVAHEQKAAAARQSWRDAMELVEKRQTVTNALLDKLVREPDNDSLAKAFHAASDSLHEAQAALGQLAPCAGQGARNILSTTSLLPELQGIFGPPKDRLAGITADDVSPEIAAHLNLSSAPTLETLTAELLREVVSWVRRYVALSEDQAVILAVWVMHTYAFDASETTPYIHITAPEKACGKPRLMDVLVAIADKPIRSGGMTAAALVRCIDNGAPTIFLDEMDAQLGGDKEYGEAIRGILNEGFRRGGKFFKCDGKSHELREFNAYSPKCFAGIGRIPETVASRSIAIEMRRKLPNETVASFRQRDVEAAAIPIRSSLAEWVDKGAVGTLSPMRPAPIPAIADRQNDIAEPLLAIAQLAGEEWLERLTRALQSVFTSQGAEDTSTGVMLLADIRDAFEHHRESQLRSVALIEYLCDIEGHPWAEWNRGKQMTVSNLARHLKKHGISPRAIRFGGEVAKGYRRGDFEEPWTRYCSHDSIPPHQAVTRLQPASSLEKPHSTAVTSTVTSAASGPHEQRSVTLLPLVTANSGRSEGTDQEVRI